MNVAPNFADVRRASVNCGFGECLGPRSAYAPFGELPRYRDDLPRFTAAQLGKKVAFPYANPAPRMDRVYTLTGYRELLNIGQPTMQNDPTEYLRSALVRSDWSAVEKYLAWQVANGADFEDIARFPLGHYKYIVSPTTLKKTYLPFSDDELREVFARFRRFANGDAATEKCILQSMETTRASVLRRANMNQPFPLTIGVCQKKGAWWRGFLVMAAAVVAIYGVTLLATAATTAGGAATAATAGSSIPAGATVITPELAAGVGAAGAAGTTGALETVTILGTASSGLSTGALIGAGAAATGAGAALAQGGAASATTGAGAAPLETVDIVASVPAGSAITAGDILGAAGAAAAGALTPTGSAPADVAPPDAASGETLPGQTDPSYLDQLLAWLKQQGIELTTQQLMDFLASKLGRKPTAGEFDYMVSGGATRAGFDFNSILPIIGALFALAIVLPDKRKR